MRKIKFRFWYKAQKEMSRPYTLEDILLCRDCQTLKLDDGNTIPREFTGLHDKNGEEIYEGDIIKDDYDKWLVVFEEGKFQAKRQDPNDPSLYILVDLDIRIEVVGNILENPDLTKL